MGIRFITLFTGNRAERGLLEPVYRAIANEHMAPVWAEFGSELSPNSNFQAGAAFAQWKILEGPPTPDFCIVPCDREEMVGVALYLFYNNIPFAQFHGGDIGSGTHDEIGRWIISRCANLHFCNSPVSAYNLVKSGEESWRVHVVGSTAFDDVTLDDAILPERPFDLLLVHPDTFSEENTKQDIEKALNLLDKYTIAVGPNEDKNYGIITEALINYHYKTGAAPYEFRASVPRPQFLSLMKHCQRFITNSSSALYELPAFGIEKWVNIGLRNKERKPLDTIEPGASARIAKILKEVELDDRLLRKKFLS